MTERYPINNAIVAEEQVKKATNTLKEIEKPVGQSNDGSRRNRYRIVCEDGVANFTFMPDRFEATLIKSYPKKDGSGYVITFELWGIPQ